MNGEHIVITGGRRLEGSVTVHGAKNAVLPLLAAGILTEEELIVEDCPYISDVDSMTELLSEIGARVLREGRRICVSGKATGARASETLCKSMRSSMFMLGALLSSTGRVEMPLPGGCDIGARPLDIHLDGLRRMGARTECDGNYLRCTADRLHGADIFMRYPSVGATENLLMCASLAEGSTMLVNCAREPEIVALAKGLKAMGAKISGEGTSVIKVEGVKRLGGAALNAGGDRIVAGTLIAAVSLCGGDVTVYGAKPEDMRSVIDAFRSQYCDIEENGVCLRVRSQGRVRARSVITAPYPLFPTDMQPQYFACQCFSDGASKICETVFDGRFAHAREFAKMGADISVCANSATVFGKEKGLHGADLIASDLRGGAGLCIAALKTEGESRVFNPHFIDRGYENFESMLSALGADIRRERFPL